MSSCASIVASALPLHICTRAAQTLGADLVPLWQSSALISAVQEQDGHVRERAQGVGPPGHGQPHARREHVPTARQVAHASGHLMQADRAGGQSRRRQAAEREPECADEKSGVSACARLLTRCSPVNSSFSNPSGVSCLPYSRHTSVIGLSAATARSHRDTEISLVSSALLRLSLLRALVRLRMRSRCGSAVCPLTRLLVEWLHGRRQADGHEVLHQTVRTRRSGRTHRSGSGGSALQRRAPTRVERQERSSSAKAIWTCASSGSGNGNCNCDGA